MDVLPGNILNVNFPKKSIGNIPLQKFVISVITTFHEAFNGIRFEYFWVAEGVDIEYIQPFNGWLYSRLPHL